MADDLETRPIGLVNFVSEEQLDQARKTRGERVEDGTAQRDRPLYEILRENKERKDAEFNERFKHRPPKALDEDETEFLEKLEMSRKEYERQIADQDAEQIRSFQEAVATQAFVVHKLKEIPAVPKIEESRGQKKMTENQRPGNFVISAKPRVKKAKTERAEIGEKLPMDDIHPPGDALGALVSYSDESDGDG
ncbi:hypothetical protein KSP40_PGU018571 [Platanthera guangdongensis]|uniref:FAM192A/Fyv6 N-terminal domain-containing protein n=1 Tax=Platanthera guangdongensis TaxID=2320717 RepID=A0ABR2MV44_9ASPA